MSSLAGVLLLQSAIIASPPGALESQPDSEIIVTGERVERRVRQTSSSVVVVTSPQIEATGADRLDQLLASIPNVQIGSGEEGPAIRGQDSTGVLRNLFAFLGGARPRVTLQVDGRPVTYYEYVSSAESVWDLKQIEVFRSPQTTTQGRNSIAGAIFVRSNDPSWDWEGKGRLIVGDARTRQFSAVVSGPMVRDQLAVRLSGDFRRSRMSSDMADGIAGADIDRDDSGQLRIKALLTPSGWPDLRAEATYVHTQSQSPQFEAVRSPFKDRRDPIAERTNGVNKVTVDSVTSRVAYQASSVLTSSLTVSFGDAFVRRYGLPGLGKTRVNAKDYSIEGNVRWVPSDQLSIVGGVHWLANRQRQYIDISGPGLWIGDGTIRDRQRSLGLFAEAEFSPTPALTLSAGARYQHDFQRREGQIGPVPGGITIVFGKGFDAFLPKVSAAYEVSTATTIGVLVQRAYNPGGTSVSLFRRVADNFDEEALWNYEVFVRSTFADGRGTVAANAFYNQIRNAQRQLAVPITAPDGAVLYSTEFANAPRARAYGLEVEFGWKLTPRLQVHAGIGLLNTRLQSTIVATDPSRGKLFQRSPHFSTSASLDWRATKSLRLSGQVRHHSRYYSDDANTQALIVPKATVVDVRGEWSVGNISFIGYARNIFNRFYMTYLFSPQFGAAGDPREFGLGVEARF